MDEDVTHLRNLNAHSESNHIQSIMGESLNNLNAYLITKMYFPLCLFNRTRLCLNVNHHHLQVLVMIKLILTLHFLLFLHLNTFQPPSCYMILAWFTFCSAIKSVASLMRTRLWILIWLSNSCQSVWSVSFLHFPLCLFNRTRLCLNVNHHHLQVLVMIKLILTLHFLLPSHPNPKYGGIKSQINMRCYMFRLMSYF